jgi:hypothetical protein
MAHPNLHPAATMELLREVLLAPLLDLPLVVEALVMASISQVQAIHMEYQCKVRQIRLLSQ